MSDGKNDSSFIENAKETVSGVLADLKNVAVAGFGAGVGTAKSFGGHLMAERMVPGKVYIPQLVIGEKTIALGRDDTEKKLREALSKAEVAADKINEFIEAIKEANLSKAYARGGDNEYYVPESDGKWGVIAEDSNKPVAAFKKLEEAVEKLPKTAGVEATTTPVKADKKALEEHGIEHDKLPDAVKKVSFVSKQAIWHTDYTNQKPVLWTGGVIAAVGAVVQNIGQRIQNKYGSESFFGKAMNYVGGGVAAVGMIMAGVSILNSAAKSADVMADKAADWQKALGDRGEKAGEGVKGSIYGALAKGAELTSRSAGKVKETGHKLDPDKWAAGHEAVQKFTGKVTDALAKVGSLGEHAKEQKKDAPSVA